MDLVELTKKELERGFTKSELERLWLLPKNSLSAILNPDLKSDFSKKAKIRVMDYFNKDLKDRPEPSPKIQKGRKPKPETTVGVLKQAIGNMGKIPVSVPKKGYDDRSNPLINAARGRDASGINEDELKKPQMPKGLSTMEQIQWKIDNP